MSRYPFLLVLFLALTFSSYGQLCDTTLFEDFQDTNLVQIPENDPQFEGDSVWVNLDEDAIPTQLDQDGVKTPQFWFYNVDFRYTPNEVIPPNDTNWVFASTSLLANFLDGNRNWLITPPIPITCPDAVLQWKSGPWQGPRYMDGYKVLLSTTGYFLEDFRDTLFVQAQMVPPLPSNPQTDNAFNVDSFRFDPPNAYIHADGYTNTQYFYRDSTAYKPILEPHEVSLRPYVGETIYIAFLHDSDDDSLIELDDILFLTEQTVSTTSPLTTLDLQLFPNPVSDQLHLQLKLDPSVGAIQMQIVDVLGTIFWQERLQAIPSEAIQRKLSIQNWPSGIYNFQLQQGQDNYTETIDKIYLLDILEEKERLNTED